MWLVGEEAKPLLKKLLAWKRNDVRQAGKLLLAMVYHLCLATHHTGAYGSFCSFTWSLEPSGSWNPSRGSLSCLNCSFPKFRQHLQSTLPPSFPTLALPEVAAGWTSEKTSVVSPLPCFRVSGASGGWQNQWKFSGAGAGPLTMGLLPPQNTLVMASWQASLCYSCLSGKLASSPAGMQSGPRRRLDLTLLMPIKPWRKVSIWQACRNKLSFLGTNGNAKSLLLTCARDLLLYAKGPASIKEGSYEVTSKESVLQIKSIDKAVFASFRYWNYYYSK